MIRRYTVLSLLAFVVLPTRGLAQTEEVRYYHQDAVGSVRLVSDGNGQIVERYDYQPSGVPVPASPTGTEPRRFGGKELDAETASDYFGARYYQSQIGRFSSPDQTKSSAAIANPQLWNKYTYSLSNPMSYIDPDGRWPYYIHDQIYDAAFSGVLAYHQLTYLKQVSFDADFARGAQAVTSSHKHSMCAAGQSAHDCSAAISGFILGNLDNANAESGGGQYFSRRSLWFFGHGIHALADMGSPVHVADNGSPLTWTGNQFSGVIHMFRERSAIGHWERIGQSIRLVIAGAQRAYPAALKRYGSVNAWANAAITAFVDDYFGLNMPGVDAGNWWAGTAARMCAMGNPAACF